MDVNVQGRTDQRDRPLTREDVEKLLQEAGSSDKLNLSWQNMAGINLVSLNLVGANLNGANLRKANLSYINLREADLSYADLSGATLRGANFRFADLGGTNLSNTELNYSDLIFTNLKGANLSYADLVGATLRGADFRYADLRGADLTGADLRGASFSKANLRRAILTYADISGAILSQNQKEQIRNSDAIGIDETSVKPRENTPMLRIRIIEEPLTPYDIATILSALTELITKLWLISKGRIADLNEYSETHDVQFAQEAGLTITEASYNSPFNIGLSLADSFKGIAEAVVILLDGIVQIKQRRKKAELDNMERELELDKKARADNLEILQKTIDLVKYVEIDASSKTMLTQLVMSSVEPLLSSKSIVIALPIPKNEAGQSAKRDREKKLR